MTNPVKTWKDWVTVIAVAAVLLVGFVAPAYLIQRQSDESDRIIREIQVESERRLEQAIHINTFTITCLLAIPPEDRSAKIFRDCIQDGFEQAPDITAPREVLP